MGMAQGVTERPVTRAHRARSPQSKASTRAAASRLTKNTTPMASSNRRSTQRARPASKSFKQPPYF